MLAWLLAISGVLITVVVAQPSWISDQNLFLREIVGHELLSVLGVIFAISLASLFQIHLKLNSIEESHRREFFTSTRREIRQAACMLIGLFGLAVVVAIVKPLVAVTNGATAITNVLAIFILSMYVLILTDISLAVFKINPNIREGKEEEDGKKGGE